MAVDNYPKEVEIQSFKVLQIVWRFSMFGRISRVVCYIFIALICGSCSPAVNISSNTDSNDGSNIRSVKIQDDTRHRTIKNTIVAKNTVTNVGYSQEENSTLGFIKSVYTNW